MRCVPLLLLALVGCAAPERYQAYQSPRLLTAEERELDLKRNVREGQSWDEQERRMQDVKGIFGEPSDADVLGPKSPSTGRSQPPLPRIGNEPGT